VGWEWEESECRRAMSELSGSFLRFIQAGDIQVEQLPWGPHEWICRPGLTEARQLLLVRVKMPAGQAHRFHRHPTMEEIIYVVEGEAEQWVDGECRRLGPGEAAHIPMDVVHGTYNVGGGPLIFLAFLAPAVFEGPGLIDVSSEEPWVGLRGLLAAGDGRVEGWGGLHPSVVGTCWCAGPRGTVDRYRKVTLDREKLEDHWVGTDAIETH